MVLIAAALPLVCAPLCLGVGVTRTLKLTALGVFGNDRCVSDADRDYHGSGQPARFQVGL